MFQQHTTNRFFVVETTNNFQFLLAFRPISILQKIINISSMILVLWIKFNNFSFFNIKNTHINLHQLFSLDLSLDFLSEQIHHKISVTKTPHATPAKNILITAAITKTIGQTKNSMNNRIRSMNQNITSPNQSP